MPKKKPKNSTSGIFLQQSMGLKYLDALTNSADQHQISPYITMIISGSTVDKIILGQSISSAWDWKGCQ